MEIPHSIIRRDSLNDAVTLLILPSGIEFLNCELSLKHPLVVKHSVNHFTIAMDQFSPLLVIEHVLGGIFVNELTENVLLSGLES